MPWAIRRDRTGSFLTGRLALLPIDTADYVLDQAADLGLRLDLRSRSWNIVGGLPLRVTQLLRARLGVPRLQIGSLLLKRGPGWVSIHRLEGGSLALTSRSVAELRDHFRREVKLAQAFVAYRRLPGRILTGLSSPARAKELLDQVTELNDRSHSRQDWHSWGTIYRGSLMAYQPQLSLPSTYAYFQALHDIRRSIRGELKVARTVDVLRFVDSRPRLTQMRSRLLGMRGEQSSAQPLETQIHSRSRHSHSHGHR